MSTSTWVNVQFALNKNRALEDYGVFAVYQLGFSSKQFQSYNKSLINQACSGPSWENIGPWSFLYKPRCARPVLSRPRADILPERPSCLVNKIYEQTLIGVPNMQTETLTVMYVKCVCLMLRFVRVLICFAVVWLLISLSLIQFFSVSAGDL